jgi:beta-lactamase class A
MKNIFLFPLLFLSFSLTVNGQSALDNLESKINEEFKRSPGLFCLAFKEIGHPKNQLMIHADSIVHAASTMKTPVMVEIFNQIEQKQRKLSDSVLIKNEFSSIVDGSPYKMEVDEDSEGQLYRKIGGKTTLYQLIYDMITHSSNLATNILIEMADAKKVTQNIREIGAKNIQVLRGVEDQKAYDLGLNNKVTARDLMLIFEKLGEGKWISESACRQMIDILKQQHFNELIPALLPKEVIVAHKTGWITRHSHDSALIILPDGRKYALVILSKGWESNDLATEILANSSKYVYDYMVGLSNFKK